MIYSKTIFELTSSGKDGRNVPPRYFGPNKISDACVRFSEAVVSLDSDPSVGGGWVALKRLPDNIYPEGMHLLHWTKTSNERPTSDGALSPEAA